MSDDRSELLDGDVLGEEPGDADRPGTVDYPPDRSLGVEDPTLYGEDDLDTRARLRREVADEAGAPDFVLVDVAPEGALDHEAALLADAETATGDDEMSAEEAAIHLVDRDPVD